MPLPDLGTLHPVALVEADVHYIPTEAEGESGFQLRRLYLGLRWAPAPWATVVGSLNPAAREHDPLIVDGTVRFTPPGPVDVSLGYGKTPLFASAHDSSIDSLAIPELSLSTGAFWPGRDLGAELHLGAPTLPVEVWLRLGNGSGSPAGNDNRHFSMDIRTDLSFGRVRIGAERSTPMGFRLGGGFHLEEAEDRAGIAGRLPTGFSFWRSPTISGLCWVAEGHMVVLAGPVMATVEGAAASEGRSRDTDGNPDTAREKLDPVRSWGGSAELAWMLTGQYRSPGAWPIEGNKLGVELAGRGERLSLGLGSDAPGGAWGAEGTLRLWSPRGLGGGLSGGVFVYDVAPLEEPEVTYSWFLAGRMTARWL